MAREKSEMVIATLFSASITNGEFNREFKTMVSAPKAVKRSWAEEFNVKTKGAGKFYEFDEDATAEFYANVKMAAMDRKAAAELESEANEVIVDVVKSIKKKKKAVKKQS